MPSNVSNVDSDINSDPELWGPLSFAEKTVLRINDTGILSFNIQLDKFGNEISNDKPIVCVIPHLCIKDTTCSLIVNDIIKSMRCPNFPKNARFFNLTYELPAGTKELSIIFEGNPNQIIAIKDIQIWQ